MPKAGSYSLIIVAQVRLYALGYMLLVHEFYSWFHHFCEHTFGMKFLAGISQPFFQILPAKYSETWFDLNGRTTATMIAAIGW